MPFGAAATFRNSSALASACGIAVTGTMVVTVCLATVVAHASDASRYFHIPTDRAIEIGTQIAV